MKQPSEHPYLDAVEQAYHTLANDAKAIVERGEKRRTDKLSPDTIHQFAVKHLHFTTYQHCWEFLRAQTQFAFAKTHQGIYDLLRELRTLRHQEWSFERALIKIQNKYHINGPYSANIMHVIRVLWGKWQHMLKELIESFQESTPALEMHEQTTTTKEKIVDTLSPPTNQLELFPKEDDHPKKTASRPTHKSKHPY